MLHLFFNTVMPRARLAIPVAAMMALALLQPVCSLASAWQYPTAMFFHDTQPTDPLAFNRGKLGIVLPSYEARYLIVAYRWMKGIPLDPQSAARLLPSASEVDMQNDPRKAIDAWLATRHTVVPQTAPTINPEKENPHFYNYVPNCLGDAFATAAETLKERERQHPDEPAAIRAWVAGQDKVFSNCSAPGALPDALPATSPSWLLQDRAYQMAAAYFYRSDYPAALHGFTAIAADAHSPWRNTADYLVARTKVKMALEALTASNSEPGGTSPIWRPHFGPPIIDAAASSAFKDAKATLLAQLHDSRLAAWHPQLVKLNDLLDARFTPDARMASLEKRILAPNAPVNIWQDVHDFVFLNDKRNPGYPTTTTLGHWLYETSHANLTRSSDEEASDAATQQWRVTHSLPWLWRALVASATRHAPDPRLLSAAAAVPANSPAYLSIQYLRLIGLRQLGRVDEARQLADQLLRRRDLTRSDRNLIQDQRMFAATSNADLVAYGTQPIIQIVYPGAEDGYFATPQTIRTNKDLNWRPELQKPNPAYFSPGAARVLSRDTPYHMLYDLLKLPMAPHNQQNVALAAWTRGWLLGDTQNPVRLIPYLAPINPEIAALLARYRNTSDAAARRFIAAVVILSLPGATPDVSEGLGREFRPDAIGLVGPRWWTPSRLNHPLPDCWHYDLEGQCLRTRPEDEISLVPPYLLGLPLKTARAEAQRMAAAGSVITATGRVVLAWAAAHPNDPLVPEALHLVVRAGRYADSGDCDAPRIAHTAFNRLHQQYPASVWTKQTPRWYANDNGAWVVSPGHVYGRTACTSQATEQ